MTSTKKKRELLARQPYCCFCGGLKAASTVDHVPPRTCFIGRDGPEGFEFPACDECQNATRLDELAFSFFVRLNDPTNANYSSQEMRHNLKGIRNNLPHLLPFQITNREKRKALRAKGLTKPAGNLLQDVSVVGIPAAIGPHIDRYSRKLAAALYYREKGKPIASDFVLWTRWAQAQDKRQMASFLEVARMSPFQTIGARTNLNFGDRFAYRYDMADDNDLFMAVAQFGQGLVIAMLIADGSSAKELKNDGWIAADRIYS